MLALNAAAALWGGTAWARRRPSIVFWYLLRTAQVAVVVQVGLGLALVFDDRRAPDDLHLLYGISLLVVTAVSEALRFGAAARELEGVADVESLSREEQRAVAVRVVLREMGIMTIGALLIVTLALRAYFGGA